MTDEAIVKAIVKEVDRTGETPSRNSLMTRYKVGTGRAARLLAMMDQALAARSGLGGDGPSGADRSAEDDLPVDPDQKTGPESDRKPPQTGPDQTGEPDRTGEDRSEAAADHAGPDRSEPVQQPGPDHDETEQTGDVDQQVSSPDQADRTEVVEVDQKPGPVGAEVARPGPVGGGKPGPVRRPPSGPDRLRAGLVWLLMAPVRLVAGLVRSAGARRSGPAVRSVVAVRVGGSVRSERLPVRSAGAVQRSGPVQPSTAGPDRHRSGGTGPGSPPVRSGRSASVLITAAPLLGLNAIAMFGQYDAFSHMPNIIGPGALGIGAVLETIALFLAHHAHQALVAGDSASRLRLASYVFGAAVGALNYHDQGGPVGDSLHQGGWDPTPLGLIFGLASALSPWLWSIHSRRTNRDRLLAMGLIERRAAKFSGARWVAYPIRTLRMLRWSVWVGEQEPAAAVAWWEDQRAARRGRTL